MNKKDHSTFTDLDGFIKFLLAIVIAILPFYFENQVSYGIFLVYLVIVTLASRIRYRTLLLSALSYFIIVLIPYLFGILLNGFLYFLTENTIFINQGSAELFLRLFRLFIIWYVSILYFQTTPTETIIGLLDKFFFPLKLLKMPVQDYLKVVMCIVIELKGTGEEMKTRFLDHARAVIGGSQTKLRSKFNGISQIIVSALVDSFQKLDELESMVAEIRPEELFNYKFKMTKPEWIAVLSLAGLILILYMLEKGYGLAL